jgi:hypothetical protein
MSPMARCVQSKVLVVDVWRLKDEGDRQQSRFYGSTGTRWMEEVPRAWVRTLLLLDLDQGKREAYKRQ